jgi:hypothetical protein
MGRSAKRTSSHFNPCARPHSTLPAFVDLIARWPGSFHECLIELEEPLGRMSLTRKQKVVYSQARDDHDCHRGLLNEEYPQ